MRNLSELILIKALDGLFMRSVAIAENIANAGTPNYRPVRVTFEDALAKAAARGQSSVAQVEPKLTRVNDLAHPEMRLDLELVDAAGTSARYASVVDVLDRQLQLRSLAVSGGRR